MEVQCQISTDFKGRPKIKVSQPGDAIEVTFDVYTQDYNLLLQNVEKMLLLSSKE
jgi:hypothetical protein